MAFTIDGVELNTSTYSQTDWTQQCVGVGQSCQCHMALADSVTQEFYLRFPNAEFAGMLATLK